MKEKRDSDGNFERKLLDELKAVVAERDAEQAAAIASATPTPAWRSRPRLALAGCAVLTAAVAVLVFSSGGDNAPRAFAVEPQEGGGVTIEIYSLEDAAGLEAALGDAGIRSQVTWLPAGKVCREPHYEPSVVRLPGGGSLGGMTMGGPGKPMTISVGSTRRWRESFGKVRRGEVSPGEMANLNLDPAAFRPGQSVVISGTPAPYGGDPEGGSIAKFGIAEGPVEPCRPVPALPSGSGGPFELTPGGGSPYVPRGDAALSQAAIAAELRRTAAVAAAADGRVEAPPGPGQLLYAKTEESHLQAWDPDGPASGPRTKPRYFTDRQLRAGGNAMPALVTTLKQVWMDLDGETRERETLDRVEFLSAGDQRRWEAAGSPPPFEYDPAEHDVGRDGSGRPVKDYRSKAFRGRREFSYLSRLAQLPTEPETLRLAIEHRDESGAPLAPSPAGSQRGGGTVARLLEILSEPMASPALRAAAFGALAEIPGIGFERGVADVAGRRGDAIAWTRGEGFGQRFIFDPRTSEILAEAEMVFDAKAAGYPGIPDETVFRETAYLESEIVER